MVSEPEHAEVLQVLLKQAQSEWSLVALREEIVNDQNCRRMVADASAVGQQTSWDYEPIQNVSQQFVRGGAWCADAEANAHLSPHYEE